MHRLLIADPSVKDEAYVKEKLKDHLEVAFCSDGRNLYSMMQQFDPDFLVLDLHLPHSDGLCMIRGIRNVGNMIPIIVTSACLRDYILADLASLCIGAVIQKPWKIDNMLDEICWIVQVQRFGYSIDIELDYILTRLGYKVGNARYNYTCKAVLERYECQDCSLTKELYPKIASMGSGGKGYPEKAIRDGIRYAKGVGDPELWQSFFPALKPGEFPKNDEFISRIAIALRHRERPRKPETEMPVEAASY